MTEIGPMLDLAEVHESTESSVWSLAWPDGTEMEVEFEPETCRLCLSSDVGPFTEGNQALAMLLLRFNALGHSTGGQRIGVMEDRILFAYEHSAHELDLPLLAEMLMNFADKARTWSELAERYANGEAENGESALHTLAAGIRV